VDLDSFMALSGRAIHTWLGQSPTIFQRWTRGLCLSSHSAVRLYQVPEVSSLNLPAVLTAALIGKLADLVPLFLVTLMAVGLLYIASSIYIAAADKTLAVPIIAAIFFEVS
jgi:hypothetical protein